jgi:hypothetical protein
MANIQSAVILSFTIFSIHSRPTVLNHCNDVAVLLYVWLWFGNWYAHSYHLSLVIHHLGYFIFTSQKVLSALHKKYEGAGEFQNSKNAEL